VTAPAFLDRRGPSDLDREAWLAARRNGVTATEIATIAVLRTKSARTKAMRELAEEKISGSSFEGNAYTRWGKEREPSLEEWGNFAFGFLPESRLSHAADDAQHLASIDGYRVSADGLLHLAEYKTSGKPLDYALAKSKGYVDQCLWQMWVTGAVDALILWEQRLSTSKGFAPGERGTVFVERDDDRIAVLVGYATEFLTVLTDLLVNGAPDEGIGDPMLDDLVTRLQDAKSQVAELDPQVRDWMTRSGMTSAKTARWNVSHEAGEAKQVPDLDAFRKAHPDEAAELDRITALAATFTKQGTVPKPTLRITARKDAK